MCARALCCRSPFVRRAQGKQAEAKASRKNRDNLCEALGRGC